MKKKKYVLPNMLVIDMCMKEHLLSGSTPATKSNYEFGDDELWD